MIFYFYRLVLLDQGGSVTYEDESQGVEFRVKDGVILFRCLGETRSGKSNNLLFVGGSPKAPWRRVPEERMSQVPEELLEAARST